MIYFQVKIENTLPQYYSVQAGVPQGSVLGPLLDLTFTADIPTTDDTLIATFAADTAILSSDTIPAEPQISFNYTSTSYKPG
jgi:hypothetical protein